MLCMEELNKRPRNIRENINVEKGTSHGDKTKNRAKIRQSVLHTEKHGGFKSQYVSRAGKKTVFPTQQT